MDKLSFSLNLESVDVSAFSARLGEPRPLAREDYSKIAGGAGEVAEKVEDALDRIKRHSFTGMETLEAWAVHPDERVPIALMESEFFNLLAEKDKIRVEAFMAQRAVKGAVACREAWTPLLEKLGQQYLWPSSFSSRGTGGIEFPHARTYQEHVLVKWISEVATDREVTELVKGSNTSMVLEAVAEGMDQENQPLLEKVIFKKPKALLHLLFRKDRTEESVNLSFKLIEEACLGSWLDATDGAVRREVEDVAKRAFTFLAASEHRKLFSDEKVEDLFVELEKAILNERESQVMGHKTSLITHVIEKQIKALGDMNLARRYAEKLLEYRLTNPLAHLITEEARWQKGANLVIDAELAEFIATRADGDTFIERSLVEREDLRVIPGVRNVLKKSKKPEVLYTLLEDARTEEFRELFQQYVSVEESQEHQLALIVDYEYIAEQALEAKDLEPLLSSKERKIRMAAITLLGRIKEIKDGTRVPVRPVEQKEGGDEELDQMMEEIVDGIRKERKKGR